MRSDRGAAIPAAMGREESIVLGALIALFITTAAWWALAFWPVESAPVWLERTRYVCFGVNDSGLPDAGGWIGLIAGPFGMLMILLVGWWDGVRELVKRAQQSRAVAAVFAMLALGVATLVLGAATRVQQVRSSSIMPDIEIELPPAAYPRLDRAAPPLVLESHERIRRSLAEHAGRVALVTFAYAHCTTVCPLVVEHVLAAQEELATTGERPVVLIVTLDPWRDTPSRLASMAAAWGLPAHDAWVLGGTVDEVLGALDAWEVPRSRDPVTGEVTHPSLIYIVDEHGRIAYATSGGARVVASLVRRL